MKKEKIKKTVCLFCSLGCSLAFKGAKGLINAIDYDMENPVNNGSLCPRGYYNLELLNHPKRLTEAYIGSKKAKWNEAIEHAKKSLKRFSPEEIAIMISSKATSEDAYVATLAAKKLGTANISACGAPCDIETFTGCRMSIGAMNQGDVEKLGSMDSLFIIGDILTRSPVLSKRINQVKYGKRGNQVIVVDPNDTRTSWFSTMHLKNKPGTEAVLMAGILKVIAAENSRAPVDIDLKHVEDVTGVPADRIEKAAKAFDDAANGCMIFAPGPDKQRNDLINHLAATCAGYSIDKKHLTFYSYGNSIGVSAVIESQIPGHKDYWQIVEGINNKKIKALVVVGEYPDCNVSMLDLIIKMDFFGGASANENTVLLPLSSHMERKGTVMFSGLRPHTLTPIAHKVGGRATWKMFQMLIDDHTEFGEILRSTADIWVKGLPKLDADLNGLVKQASMIKPLDSAKESDITHLGGNELVRNFFWYRVNNGRDK